MMGLIKESLEVDFSNKSEPWSEKELVEFRKIMQTIKLKNATRKKKGMQNNHIPSSVGQFKYSN
jgi:hypothetical protein